MSGSGSGSGAPTGPTSSNNPDGSSNLVNQYPLRAIPTRNLVSPWVAQNVPAGPSYPASALLHHIDTHASRLSTALAEQGSAPTNRHRRLNKNLQFLYENWPNAEWHPARFPVGAPPPENVVTAMKSLTKLAMKNGWALGDLWAEDDEDDACGLIIQAWRQKRAVLLTEEVMKLALKKAKDRVAALEQQVEENEVERPRREHNGEQDQQNPGQWGREHDDEPPFDEDPAPPPANSHQPSPPRFSPARFSPARFSPARFSPARFSPDRGSPIPPVSADRGPAPPPSDNRQSPPGFSPDRCSPPRWSPERFSSPPVSGPAAPAPDSSSGPPQSGSGPPHSGSVPPHAGSVPPRSGSVPPGRDSSPLPARYSRPSPLPPAQAPLRRSARIRAAAAFRQQQEQQVHPQQQQYQDPGPADPDAAARRIVSATMRTLTRQLGREANSFGPRRRANIRRAARQLLESSLGVGRR